MKDIETQITLEDTSPEYQAFVDKFKPKKTTDDCYTPENVYNVVRDWACKEYGINPDNIVRPFWPGGNYEKFEYKENSVVVDNPPFSIVSKICAFYVAHDIPFFLFAPYLTNFGIGSGDKGVSHIITEVKIVYENGARVRTSFVTNLDECLVRSAPDLDAKLEEANAENRNNSQKVTPPKYEYPDEILTATMVGHFVLYGVEFSLKPDECYFIRTLDAQREYKKGIFGSGFLLSREATKRKLEAEQEATKRKLEAEQKPEQEATKWVLSDRELKIIEELSKGEKDNEEKIS